MLNEFGEDGNTIAAFSWSSSIITKKQLAIL
jgi:hypothetical protein